MFCRMAMLPFGSHQATRCRGSQRHPFVCLLSPGGGGCHWLPTTHVFPMRGWRIEVGGSKVAGSRVDDRGWGSFEVGGAARFGGRRGLGEGRGLERVEVGGGPRLGILSSSGLNSHHSGGWSSRIFGVMFRRAPEKAETTFSKQN